MKILRSIIGSTHSLNIGALGFLVLVCLVITVPWHPAVVDPENVLQLAADLSGIFGGGELIAQGKLWGSDVVFPHGPLFYLRFPIYISGLYASLIIGSVVIAIGMGAGLSALITAVDFKTTSRYVVVALAMVLAVIVTWIAPTRLDPIHTIMFAIMNILFFIRDKEGHSAELTAVTIATAALALGKFPFFLLFFFNIGLMLVADLLIRKRFPMISLIGVASLFMWWFISGQTAANFIPYVKTSFASANGFNDAMVIGYLDLPRVINVAILLAGVGILLATQLFSFGRYANRAEGFLSLLGFGALYFIHFKHGVVRHDGHVAHAAVAFIVFSVLWLFLLPYRTKKTVALPIIMLAIWISIGLLGTVYAGANHREFKMEAYRLPSWASTWGYVTNQWRDFTTFVAEGDAPLKLAYDKATVGVRQKVTLPDLPGTWDAFTDFAAVLIYEGKQYQPRPNFIGLNVYDPFSAKLNGAYMRGPNAPDNILYHTFALDYKLPTTEDNRTWRELLSRYDWYGKIKDFHILTKAQNPRPYTMTPLEETTLGWGEKLEIDNKADRMVWAEVDINPSLIGRVIRFLFKIPEIFINIETNSGSKYVNKIAISSVKGGFLLSPMIQNDLDMFSMYDEGFRGYRVANGVKSFSFDVSRPRLSFLYQDDISVRLHWLDMKGSPQAANKPPELMRMMRLQGAKALSPKDAAIPAEMRYETGIPVLLAHAPMTITFPAAPDTSSVKVKFGMLPGAYSSPKLGDGVIFIVKGVRSDGTTQQLWRRWLKPSEVVADQGEQTATFDLPSGIFTHLAFETNGAGSLIYDAAYWSDILIK